VDIYIEDDFYSTLFARIVFPVPISSSTLIQFYPEQNLFTYKDINSTVLYFYYYNPIDYTFQNANATLSISPDVLYKIVDGNLITYRKSTKALRIYEISIDIKILALVKTVQLNLIQKYTRTITSNSNLLNFEITTRNQIFLYFEDNTFLYYTPKSQYLMKYKHFQTFKELKVDQDLLYKNEEFFSNVKKVNTANYVNNWQQQLAFEEGNDTKQSSAIQDEFTFYAVQKVPEFNQMPEGSVFYDEPNDLSIEKTIKTFDLDVNIPCFFENELTTNKYFDTSIYNTFASIIGFLNNINNNSTLPPYEISVKTYIGMTMNLNGGTNWLQYRYKAQVADYNTPDYYLNNSQTFSTFTSKEFTNFGSKEFWTSTGIKLPSIFGNYNQVYQTRAEPSTEISSEGIYSEIYDGILGRIKLIFNPVTKGLNDKPLLGTIFYWPQNVNIYVAYKVNVKVRKEKFNPLTTTLVNVPMNYGIFSNISKSGDVITTGSSLDTESNITNTSNRVFTVYYESKIDVAPYHFRALDNPVIVTGTFLFNRDQPLQYPSTQPLHKLIDTATINSTAKLINEINRINGLGYGNLINIVYNTYLALYIKAAGFCFNSTKIWVNNGAVLIGTDGFDGGYDKDKEFFSPTGNLISDVQKLQLGYTQQGTTPRYGSRWPNAYYYYPGRLVSDFTFDFTRFGGCDLWVKAISCSYVVNMDITFTEQYFQLYVSATLKYTNLYFYIKDMMRWRHLNTIAFKNSKIKPLRESKSLIKDLQPDILLPLTDNLYAISKNKKFQVLRNITYDKYKKRSFGSVPSLINLIIQDFPPNYEKYYYLYKGLSILDDVGKKLAMSSNFDENGILFIGGVNKYVVFNVPNDPNEPLVKLREFSNNDKSEFFYINDKIVYNSLGSKNLIRKYDVLNEVATVNPVSGSVSDMISGTQYDNDYNYNQYGNSFAIFDNIYDVIGTTDGKVIIKNQQNRNIKTVIDCGNRNFTYFGSQIVTGNMIYINAPEQNKLYIIEPVYYYE
jgi:hypothetical protein